MKVLIVEDNDFDRQLIANVVQRIPALSAEHAVCIQDARERFADHDVVILDIKLPERPGELLEPQGGAKVAAHIRAKSARPETPIFVIVSQFRSKSSIGSALDHVFAHGPCPEWVCKFDGYQALFHLLSRLASGKAYPPEHECR